MTAGVFAFGGFRLDASRRLLFGADGEVVPLNSRAFDTLQFLVENPHRLLDKATLLAAVWPNTVVEDNNLSQCILALRRALGEKPGEHRFIVTVPGRGYRFVAAVERVVTEDPQPPPVAVSLPQRESPPQARAYWQLRAGTLAALAVLAVIVSFTASRSMPDAAIRTAVAVLPFTDLSSRRDQEVFADGLSEELLGRLDDQRGITVIGRNSSFAYKGRHEDLRQVGRVLGADYVVEGSIREDAGLLRVTVHLVEALGGTRVWSGTYERETGNVLALQEELARSIAPRVAHTVGAQRRATAPASAPR